MGIQANWRVYEATSIRAEPAERYRPGGLCPVYLGDRLNDRYAIFRKLGFGGQSTVWLARDLEGDHSIVVIKVHTANSDSSPVALPVQKTHTGRPHVEQLLDSFTLNSANGSHLCTVLEPLGRTLLQILNAAYEIPRDWSDLSPRLRKYESHQWSGRFAREVCRQIMIGLEFLYDDGVAHRDMQTGNVALSLSYNISRLTENEIQRDVWGEDKEEEKPDARDREEERDSGETDPVDGEDGQDTFSSASKNDAILGFSESGDEGPGSSESRTSEVNYDDSKEQGIERTPETTLEAGDTSAPPHSPEWCKGNLKKSQGRLNFIKRLDGAPLSPGEPKYTVGPSPLHDKLVIDEAASTLIDLEYPSFRVVLIDLGFSCRFEDCASRPLQQPGNFRVPETLLDLPATYKADIFSAGLLLWQTVMLRPLVEMRFDPHSSPGSRYEPNRQLRDFAQRLGPMPERLRAVWPDANLFLDEEGNARGTEEDPDDPETFDEEDYEFGDMRFRAFEDRPVDMTDDETEAFLDLLGKMLRWLPEERPETKEVLGHPWFRWQDDEKRNIADQPGMTKTN